ncbi:glutathione S-transferase-like [Ceratina calcarata]|uniref:glutathione transferase n=1 Tax=Ceratina calcarata TaxID=156304 RepID=A0AAJ7NBX6_9HYME|nr:glutathione S-transferase-like [Ceratina calcarata]
MSSYKLIYFNVTGLGEPIRFLLHQSGIAYEEKLLTFDDWKPEVKAAMPLGQVPVLEIDGKPYVQSKAIGRLIAKRNNLYGANDVEAYEIDATIDFFEDLRLAVSSYHWAENDVIKKHWKTQLDTKLPFTLQKLDAQIKKNGGFLVAGKLTWADLLVVAQLELIDNNLGTEVEKDYPELKKLKEKVRSLPKIKAYLNNRAKLLY